MHSDIRFQLLADGELRPRLGGPVDGVALLSLDQATTLPGRSREALLSDWLNTFGSKGPPEPRATCARLRAADEAIGVMLRAVQSLAAHLRDDAPAELRASVAAAIECGEGWAGA